MNRPDYSLSLDSVICSRCNTISRAEEDTCPNCGADRHGAIFTSRAEASAPGHAAAAAIEPEDDPLDYADLRDTGWLTRMARRKMVTSYPSLAEPGEALPGPGRKPARKGTAVLIGGAIAVLAAGSYVYTQTGIGIAPIKDHATISAAGAIRDKAARVNDVDQSRRDEAARAHSESATSVVATPVKPDDDALMSPKPAARVAAASNGTVTAEAAQSAMVTAAPAPVAKPNAASAQAAVAANEKRANVAEPVAKPVASSIATGDVAPKVASRTASATERGNDKAAVTTSATMAAGTVASAPVVRGAQAAQTAQPVQTAQTAQTAHATPTSVTPAVTATASKPTALSPAFAAAAMQAQPQSPASAERSRQSGATLADAAKTPHAPVIATQSLSQPQPQQRNSVLATKQAEAPVLAAQSPSAYGQAAPKQAAPATESPTQTAASLSKSAPAASPQMATTPAAQSRTQTAIASTQKAPASASQPVAAAQSQPAPVARQTAQTALASRPPQPEAKPRAAAPATATVVTAAQPKPQDTPSPAVGRTVAAVEQSLAARDLTSARRHLRTLHANELRSPEIQQLAADVSRQERARDAAIANARACAINREASCAVRNARRAVALEPRNPQAQGVLRQAMAVQTDANAEYFRQTSAIPSPAVPAMTFDGRWSVSHRHAASADNDRSNYTLFGLGVPTVAKGRGDAH